jgi:hypothetical protein
MSVSSLLAAKGAAITFTNPPTSVGYDSATDTMPDPSTTDTMPDPSTPVTVSGMAMGVGGPEDWKTNTNIDKARVRLVFEPSTPGAKPAKGATCAWAGETWAVLDVDPVAMNGAPIGAFIDLER